MRRYAASGLSLRFKAWRPLEVGVIKIYGGIAKVSLSSSLKDPFIAVDANGIGRRADVVDIFRTREQMDRRLTVEKQEVRVNRATKWRWRCLLSEKSFVDLCQDSNALLRTRN